jgi:hypothetical protein
MADKKDNFENICEKINEEEIFKIDFCLIKDKINK